MAAFSIRDLSFTYPNENSPALENITMDIPEGKITLICGTSGSGKSTLLRRMKSCLADHGKSAGEVLFFGRALHEISEIEQARRIGFVFQHPDDQIVTDKVFHELAFGPESLGWGQQKMRLAVAEMASYFGLAELFEKNVAELSGGQKQLINLASVAVMRPDVLILDEPTSQLDPIAAADFLGTLRKLNEDLGLSVILTEHRLEEALPMADMLAVLENGRLIAYEAPEKAAMQIKDSAVFESMPASVKIFAAFGGEGDVPLTVGEGRAFIASHAHNSVDIMQMNSNAHGDAAVELKKCWFRYERNAPDVLCGLDLTLYKGEICALLGGNGSGKSTTVGLLSGRLKPYRGKVKNLGARVAALPQDPRELFVKDTVSDELEELGSDMAEIDRIVKFLDIESLLERHPFDISGGEQQRLALGKVLLTSPDVILLDEPTKGMDGKFKRRFGELLLKLRGEGKSIFLVSHDIEFCARYADRCALLFRGETVTESAPREFFSGNFFYTTAAAKLSRAILDGAVLAEEVIECLKQGRTDV